MHRPLIKILAGRDNVGLKNLADPEIPDLQSCMHGLPPPVCGGQLCRTKPRHRQLGARHCCQCAWCRHLPWRGRPCSSKPWLHSPAAAHISSDQVFKQRDPVRDEEPIPLSPCHLKHSLKTLRNLYLGENCTLGCFKWRYYGNDVNFPSGFS